MRLPRAPWVVIALCLGWTSPTRAQEPRATQEPEVPAGSEPRRESIGGPDSVRRSVKTRDQQESIFDLEHQLRFAAPYFDFERRMKDDHGLSWGFSAHVLGQKASDTLSGETTGASTILRFQGSWVAVGRGTGHAGQLDWRLEDRRSPFNAQTPFQLGEDTGVTALNSANGYQDRFDGGFSILSWTQFFLDRHLAVGLGRLAYDVHQDVIFVQGFSRGFLNRGIFLNPTIGTTGVGALGGILQAFVTDNVWLGGQFFDANAKSASFDIDTVREGEFLKNVELGWTPSLERYENDRVHLTLWEKDARAAAGTSSGRGWAFSGSYEVAEGVLPFLRCGQSDGGAGVPAEASAALGFEWKHRPDRAWSLGAMWAVPSSDTFGANLNDEYAIETSYGFLLSRNLSLMPDLQLLIDPANNPTESTVWVLGLRMILSV